MPRKWDQAEVAFLRENATKMKIGDIANALGRSVAACRQQMDGGQAFRAKWSDNDEQFLIENYTNLPIREIAAALHRSANSVTQRARALGLSKQRQRKWSGAEEEFLIRNWGEPAAFLEKMLGRSIDAIRAHGKLLKMKDLDR